MHHTVLRVDDEQTTHIFFKKCKSETRCKQDHNDQRGSTVYTPVVSHADYITSHKREAIQLSLYLRGGKVYSSSDVVESKSEETTEV